MSLLLGNEFSEADGDRSKPRAPTLYTMSFNLPVSWFRPTERDPQLLQLLPHVDVSQEKMPAREPAGRSQGVNLYIKNLEPWQIS